MEYTIVEPSFELIPPRDDYLEFLEECTRTCYKSEHLIKEGSAEKLMNKVVKEYEHYSVTEHANAILEIESSNPELLLLKIFHPVPLFAQRFDILDKHMIRISGNVRMWMELINSTLVLSDPVWMYIEGALAKKWPFFFKSHLKDPNPIVRLIDDNPMTNTAKLDKYQMLRHMTLTGRIICSRACSHQIVRHRKFAYSQESQRYCNYGKKGFQFIRPPSMLVRKDGVHILTEIKNQYPFREEEWLKSIRYSCDQYLKLLKEGVPPEDARSVLPNATKTEIVMTGTLADWRHVFKHRAYNQKSQWEIRQIMLDADKQITQLLGWSPHEVKYGKNKRHEGSKD